MAMTVQEIAQKVIDECHKAENDTGRLLASVFNHILEDAIRTAGFSSEDEKATKRTEVAYLVHKMAKEERRKMAS